MRHSLQPHFGEIERRDFLTTTASGLGAIGLGATLEADGLLTAGAANPTHFPQNATPKPHPYVRHGGTVALDGDRELDASSGPIRGGAR